MADVGARTTAEVVAQARDGGRVRRRRGRRGADRSACASCSPTSPGRARARIDLTHEPTVIMVAGVNGTGKTTTIGKLAWHLQRELGKTVVLGAADTFRAAAVEQLAGWAQRAGCEIVTGPEGSDPGSVAFEAVRQGRERGVDVIIVDTAGRLHTQDELMAELAKVRRVIAKQLPDAPHETLLTVDATTGQNGLRQAKLFSEAVPVDGIVLTKLDGTAKGGIALAIAGELGHPGQADRHRRGARGPAPVRRRRLRRARSSSPASDRLGPRDAPPASMRVRLGNGRLGALADRRGRARGRRDREPRASSCSRSRSGRPARPLVALAGGGDADRGRRVRRADRGELRASCGRSRAATSPTPPQIRTGTAALDRPHGDRARADRQRRGRRLRAPRRRGLDRAQPTTRTRSSSRARGCTSWRSGARRRSWPMNRSGAMAGLIVARGARAVRAVRRGEDRARSSRRRAPASSSGSAATAARCSRG